MFVFFAIEDGGIESMQILQSFSEKDFKDLQVKPGHIKLILNEVGFKTNSLNLAKILVTFDDQLGL